MKTPRVRLVGNCQFQGLQYFLRRALPSWDIVCFVHYGTDLSHYTPEQLEKEHAEADIVFFHHKMGEELPYPTKNPKIPLSVWFQSSPFMIQIPQPIWDDFKLQGFRPEDAIDYDFDYHGRWRHCHSKMMEKEEHEGVPSSLRISDLMEEGYQTRLQLTCNHPTSVVFRYWTLKILNYLGESCKLLPSMEECLTNDNLSGLPCHESATSGARRILGLSWGGRPEDDQSGLDVARERMKL